MATHSYLPTAQTRISPLLISLCPHHLTRSRLCTRLRQSRVTVPASHVSSPAFAPPTAPPAPPATAVFQPRRPGLPPSLAGPRAPGMEGQDGLQVGSHRQIASSTSHLWPTRHHQVAGRQRPGHCLVARAGAWRRVQLQAM